MLPTGWETGNTYWRRFIRRNGRFILNIESQSECYYYEFLLLYSYCSTSRLPIQVTSERDTTINRLLTVVTFHSICDYDWALSSKIQRLRYTNPFKKFHPTDLWLNRLYEYFFRGSYPQKPCAIGKDLTVFIKEIGVSRRILVIQFASIFCNRLIFLLTKSQHSYI